MTKKPKRDPIERVELGHKLRLARRYLGLTQEAVAARIDISRTLLIAIEQGNAPVTDEKLTQLAAIYRRPVGYFQGIEPEFTKQDRDAVSPKLLAAVKDLQPEDQYQVLRFAQFLRLAGVLPPIQSED